MLKHRFYNKLLPTLVNKYCLYLCTKKKAFNLHNQQFFILCFYIWIYIFINFGGLWIRNYSSLVYKCTQCHRPCPPRPCVFFKSRSMTQAPCELYHRLAMYFCLLGFVASTFDTSLFTKMVTAWHTYCSTLTGPCLQPLKEFYSNSLHIFKRNLPWSTWGSFHFFVHISITCSSGGLFISQW